MFVVLKEGDGYYQRNARDYDYKITYTLNDAQVFKITCKNGKLTTEPELPDGEWKICEVTLTLKRD